jgi:hypothetical protein
MSRFAIFRRRLVPVPTLPGLIVILLGLGFPLYYLFINVANFLAIDQPVGAEYLVIEGWLGKSELDQANRIFNTQGYKFAIVSGGPIIDGFNERTDNFADRAKGYLLSTGFPETKLVAVPAPYSAQERTFLSAVMVRDWLSSQGIVVDSLDVFSADVHSRRSRDLYRLAFGGDVSVGVYASTPSDFDLDRWWQTSDSAKAVASESLGWLAVKCCFDPGGKGSHFERWGMHKSVGN